MPKRAAIEGGRKLPALRDFPPSKRYLIGVSGGRDSVALLHWLLARGYRRLIVCHLDHRLRGRASTADAQFVARLADANGLESEIENVEVRSLAAATKQSIEAAARAARYEFFARVARRRRCHAIFLGHHADDLVESFLINLFRGSGTTGQRGMQKISRRLIGSVELTIIRPLLGVWRSDIDEYVREHRLRFRDDASNDSLEPLRNRLRHSVIPMLTKEFGRDIRKAVRRAAVIATDEDEMLNEMIPVTSERLRLAPFRALPVTLQRRGLARWLRAQQVRDISFDLVEQIRAMLDPLGGPAKINLPRDRHVRRRSGELFIEASRVGSASA